MLLQIDVRHLFIMIWYFFGAKYYKNGVIRFSGEKISEKKLKDLIYNIRILYRLPFTIHFSRSVYVYCV